VGVVVGDELRPADLADLLVDILGLDGPGRGVGQEIADLLEERGVGIHVEWPALVRAVPAVDLGLQAVAESEQFAVLRPEIADDGGKPCPERIRGDPRLGRRFLGDEIEQDGGDLQSVGVDTLHDGFFSQETAPTDAILGNFRSKKRAKGRELPASFNAKAGRKKSLSMASHAVRPPLKY